MYVPSQKLPVTLLGRGGNKISAIEVDFASPYAAQGELARLLPSLFSGAHGGNQIIIIWALHHYSCLFRFEQTRTNNGASMQRALNSQVKKAIGSTS